jgi:hypothetical protein
MTKLRRADTIDPRDLATKPEGRMAFRHPSTAAYRRSMRVRAIQAQLRWTGLGLVPTVLASLLLLDHGTATVLVAALPILLIFTALGTFNAWRTLLEDTRTIYAQGWSDATAEANSLARGLGFDRSKLQQGLNAILHDRGSDMDDVKARLILRLAAIQSVRAGITSLVGSDAVALTEKARIAAIRTALDDAVAEQRIVRAGSVDAVSRSFEDASRVGAAPTSPAASLTGNARINRLVANAETALEIDPDLVDAGGARIDALVREHLPRLLSRHAELSLITPLDGIDEADVNLEKGVELVRASVAEAIAGLRGNRADALRTEIAFLRMRRNAAA